jgi:hypothetical protein
MAKARSLDPAADVPDAVLFRLLALCTQRPGEPRVAAPLSAALSKLPAGAGLVEWSDHHGLAPLLLAHVRALKAAVPPAITVHLFAQQKRHAHAAAVRGRIVGQAIRALAAADVPLLVLKGAALARLVYDCPAARPMRDVDLLVPRRDAKRAYEILRAIGFVPGERETSADHHHRPGLVKGEHGTAVVIELHHQLLPPTAFVAPLDYAALCDRAQSFEWDGLTLQTLGREDMLWHVYAHAFVINPLYPGVRLVSLADLVHAVEAWVNLLDWPALRGRYPRMVRALAFVERLVPWSTRVSQVLGVDASPRRDAVRPVSGSLHWSAAISRDVLWPDDWWFRMRYGIEGRWRWWWCRGAAHPVSVLMAAARTAGRRLSHTFAVRRRHRLLDR